MITAAGLYFGFIFLGLAICRNRKLNEEATMRALRSYLAATAS